MGKPSVSWVVASSKQHTTVPLIVVLLMGFTLLANLTYLRYTSRAPQVAAAGAPDPATASTQPGMQQVVSAAAVLVAKELASAAAFGDNSIHAAAIRDRYGLFVGVLSASGNMEARQAIRDTWGQDPRLLRVMFFCLRPKSNDTFLQLQHEAVQYGDLLVTSEVAEDYCNITYSTLALYRAAAAHGPQVKYVLKADDDCFIRVPVLLAALQGAPSTWLYAGWPLVPAAIPRPPGRWGVPYSQWASNESVVYGWGNIGYVLSIDLGRRIAAGAPHLGMRPDNLVMVEDLAVGIWVDALAKRDNATVNHLVFAYNYSTLLTGCDLAAVSSSMPEPRAANMRCTHQHGGQCCRL